jgi:tRNA uridine 5-carboxymethylaminomethyl modification enzyme
VLRLIAGNDLGDSVSLAQLAHRPNIRIEALRDLMPNGQSYSVREIETALADLLYEGYIQAQRSVVDRLKNHDGLRIPGGFKFAGLAGLSHEMAERLERARPLTFGQARRIPGLTPAAQSLILVELTANATKVA